MAATSILSTDSAFSAVQNTYGSPYTSKQISGRVDYHINSKNNLFIRYSHDGNVPDSGQSLEFWEILPTGRTIPTGPTSRLSA